MLGSNQKNGGNNPSQGKISEDTKVELSKLVKEELKNYGFPDPLTQYFGVEYLTEKGRMKYNNRILTLICGFLIVLLIFFMIVFYNFYSEKEFAISLPDYGQINVNKMKADPLYYRVWGDYVLTNVANYSPRNIEDKLKRLQKIFDSRSWNFQKVYLEKYQQAILENSVTQTFFFQEPDVEVKLNKSGNRAKVTYNGKATQYLGEFAKVERKCSYTFIFYVQNGSIRQESLKTDCMQGEASKKQEQVDDSERKKEEKQKAQTAEFEGGKK